MKKKEIKALALEYVKLFEVRKGYLATAQEMLEQDAAGHSTSVFQNMYQFSTDAAKEKEALMRSIYLRTKESHYASAFALALLELSPSSNEALAYLMTSSEYDYFKEGAAKLRETALKFVAIYDSRAAALASAGKIFMDNDYKLTGKKDAAGMSINEYYSLADASELQVLQILKQASESAQLAALIETIKNLPDSENIVSYFYRTVETLSSVNYNLGKFKAEDDKRISATAHEQVEEKKRKKLFGKLFS
jgi:hypothetical protein